MTEYCKQISIITISRNAAKTINYTINSVIGQDYPDFEYIIIDGSSTDGTMDIVKSFGNRINHVVSEPDNGISDAFNKGIALSNGTIIGIINADDELLPGTLNAVVNYFSLNPDVTVIHGDVLLYDGERMLKRLIPPLCWWYPWRMIVINHPATFVRRGVYDRCGLYATDIRYAMDIDMYLRWKKHGESIHYLPMPLAKMRTGGVGGRNAIAAFAEGRRVMLVHQYSWLLATIQFCGRCFGHVILMLKGKL